VHRRAGEWVAPGETLVRIVRIDRLRAEGFIDAALAEVDLVGAEARLAITSAGGEKRVFAGVVVFVSPEIDPVNGQVKIWAEIENRSLALRPGLRGELTVSPSEAKPEGSLP
jgi:multidrug efflux pump subunit AcrA (membrane-fusion protein)